MKQYQLQLSERASSTPEYTLYGHAGSQKGDPLAGLG